MNTVNPTWLENDGSLARLRTLRRLQAWGLLVFSIASIVGGWTLARTPGDEAQPQFLIAFGWQCMIWGAIDSIFALLGVTQSVRADRRPATPQASADEFLAGEKLLRSLRFNGKLNVVYVAVGVGLIAWAMAAQSPALAGHGVGVLVQGGFLLLFDAAFASRLDRLMNEPVL